MWSKLLFLLGILLLGLVGLMMALPDPDQETSGTEYRGIATAVTATPTWQELLHTPLSDEEAAMPLAKCTSFIKDRLTAPATAEFPWSFDEYQMKRLTSPENAYNIEGYFLLARYIIALGTPGNC
jgi:hypothetical protein